MKQDPICLIISLKLHSLRTQFNRQGLSVLGASYWTETTSASDSAYTVIVIRTPHSIRMKRSKAKKSGETLCSCLCVLLACVCIQSVESRNTLLCIRTYFACNFQIYQRSFVSLISLKNIYNVNNSRNFRIFLFLFCFYHLFQMFYIVPKSSRFKENMFWKSGLQIKVSENYFVFDLNRLISSVASWTKTSNECMRSTFVSTQIWNNSFTNFLMIFTPWPLMTFTPTNPINNSLMKFLSKLMSSRFGWVFNCFKPSTIIRANETSLLPFFDTIKWPDHHSPLK